MDDRPFRSIAEELRGGLDEAGRPWTGTRRQAPPLTGRDGQPNTYIGSPAHHQYMIARAEVRFYGKVQGVSFRAYARRYAIAAGVHGWVRNLPDGSVEAVFEGERPDIERVVHRLCSEHPVAEVERFVVDWSPGTGDFDSFSIRH